MRLGGGGPLLDGTSNIVTVGRGLDKAAICGITVEDLERTLTRDVSAGTAVAARVSTTAAIAVGSFLWIDDGGDAELVDVTAVDSDTVTASFARNHRAGVKVLVQRRCLASVGQDDIARSLTPYARGYAYDGVAVDSSDERRVAIRSSWGQTPFFGNSFWRTNDITSSPPAWQRVDGGVPAELATRAQAICGFTFDAA